MKKLFLILLSTTIIISSSIFGVSAVTDYDFCDNNVIICLTEEATEKVENGELVINESYFDTDLGIIKVESLSYGSRPNFYLLTLDKNDQENVLKVVKILKDNDDFLLVEPNYHTHPNGSGLSKYYISLKSGNTAAIKAKKISVTKWKSSNNKIATVKNGKITALKKGSAIITTLDSKGGKHFCVVNVSSSPKLVIKNKIVKSVKVKKGHTVKVKISGKAKSINNRYTNSRYAKIVSKKTSKTVSVRGLKKGTTNLKIKVNGVKILKLKVIVK